MPNRRDPKAKEFAKLADSELDRKLETLAKSETAEEQLDLYQVELELQHRELETTNGILEDTVDLYSTLYDNAPGGSINFDGRGCITALNLTTARLLETEREELIGKPFIHWLDRSSIPAFYSHIAKLRDEKRRTTTYVQLRNSQADTVILITQPCSFIDDEQIEFQCTLIEQNDLRV